MDTETKLSEYNERAFQALFGQKERPLDAPDRGDITQAEVTEERYDIMSDDDRLDDFLVRLLECERAREFVRAISVRDIVTAYEIFNGEINEAAIESLEG